MSDLSSSFDDLNFDTMNFDNMTVGQFKEYLPELFATGGGKVSEDPRFTTFLEKNPDCLALVKDLETIADHAKSLFEPAEPADSIWSNIASKLKDVTTDESADPV